MDAEAAMRRCINQALGPGREEEAVCLQAMFLTWLRDDPARARAFVSCLATLDGEEVLCIVRRVLGSK